MTVEQKNIDALAETRKKFGPVKRSLEGARCDLLDSQVDELLTDIDQLADKIKRIEYIEQAVLNGEDSYVAYARWTAEMDAAHAK